MRDDDGFLDGRVDEQLKSLVWHMRHIDSAGLTETLRPLIRAAELGTGHYDIEPDEMRRVSLDALQAVRQVLSRTIHRDVARHNLEEFLDQAFSPVMRRIANEGEAVPEACLVLRDLRLALSGERRLARPITGWAIVPPDRLDWTDDPQVAIDVTASLARDLQRAARIDIRVATTEADIRSYKGVILPERLEGRALLLAGVALGARVPAVVADPTMGPNPFGFPVARDAASALALLRDRLATEEHAIDEDHLVSEACLVVGEGLTRLEEQDLRGAVEKLIDRHAAKDVEVIKLVREHGIERPYFEIYANGSRMGMEPLYAQRLNGARHRIEKQAAEIRRLSAAAEPDTPADPD